LIGHLIQEGKMNLYFNYQHSKRQVTLKLLTHGKQKKWMQEMKGLAKLKKNAASNNNVEICYYSY
jgi:hypothetical protein